MHKIKSWKWERARNATKTPMHSHAKTQFHSLNSLLFTLCASFFINSEISSPMHLDELQRFPFKPLPPFPFTNYFTHYSLPITHYSLLSTLYSLLFSRGHVPLTSAASRYAPLRVLPSFSHLKDGKKTAKREEKGRKPERWVGGDRSYMVLKSSREDDIPTRGLSLFSTFNFQNLSALSAPIVTKTGNFLQMRQLLSIFAKIFTQRKLC